MCMTIAAFCCSMIWVIPRRGLAFTNRSGERNTWTMLADELFKTCLFVSAFGTYIVLYETSRACICDCK
jgi:hypothetical protein